MSGSYPSARRGSIDDPGLREQKQGREPRAGGQMDKTTEKTGDILAGWIQVCVLRRVFVPYDGPSVADIGPRERKSPGRDELRDEPRDGL